jgi:hypothetical protein
MRQKSHADAGDRGLEGRYANYFKVGHNIVTGEFVIDFGQYYPENRNAGFHTRIITSHAYVKALLETLQESMETYEEQERAFKVVHDGE